MRTTAFKLSAAILAFCGLTNSAQAQTSQSLNVVTTAVPFLRVSPDARSGGMGDQGVATSPDAFSGYWNGGKVVFNQAKGGLGVTYTPWLKNTGINDVYYVAANAFYKLDELGAIHGSVRYFSLGNIQFTDGLGNNLSSFRPREFAVDAGYSRRLGVRSGIGVTLKYINSNLAGGTSQNGVTYKAGSTVAGDIGFYSSRKDLAGQGWSFGAAMNNLGGKISYSSASNSKDFIPANLALGTTYTRVFNVQNKITFGVEANKLLVPTPPLDASGNFPSQAQIDAYRSKGVVGSWFSSLADAPGGMTEEFKEFTLSFGAEYWYNNMFALRAGYFWEDKTKGSRRYFTAGLGLKYTNITFNFAYIAPSGSGAAQSPLSNTLRFSLLFDFLNSVKK